MKRIAIILFSLLCCFILASCGEGEESQVIDGTLVEMGNSNIEITVDDSVNYIFSIKDVEITGEKYGAAGYDVRVEYEGDLTESKTVQEVKVISVTITKPEYENNTTEKDVNKMEEDFIDNNPIDNTEEFLSPETEDNSDSLASSISGTVTSMTYETISIDAEGVTYIFNIEGTGFTGNDFAVGDLVTLEYTGSLVEGSETTAINITVN